jgi:uncharacterized membrane protein YagU involved in acid resistance
LIAGTLDIGMAFVTAGRAPDSVLRSVASGPFGGSMNEGGMAVALLGLLVHFAIMAVMAGVFVAAGQRWTQLVEHPVAAGLAYGFALYVAMYWIVLPLRWPEAFPIADPVEVAKALFAHMVLVGLPIALIAAQYLRPRTA